MSEPAGTEVLAQEVQRRAGNLLRSKDEIVESMIKRALAEGRPHVYAWLELSPFAGDETLRVVASLHAPGDPAVVVGTVERYDLGTGLFLDHSAVRSRTP